MLRLFVALELDEGLRRQFARAQQALGRARTRLRAAAPDQLHLTLAFLGDRPYESVALLRAELNDLGRRHGAQTLRFRGLDVFGDRRHPRVVFAAVEPPTDALDALARETQHRLLDRPLDPLAAGSAGTEGSNGPAAGDHGPAIGDHGPAFRGHVTLARVKGPPEDLFEHLAPWQDYAFGECWTDELCLVASTRESRGPAYTTLYRAPLAAAEG